eukprot:TRINITY_DN3001_c0_g1_i1.p1 TRINITY_DN3001_c0_g1~~TRINITY_DN3001_c0_g1_i1.p1  ORF type:complete len:500 (+),score=37.55 TRINITY_DN3001_c0_g1_i1:170-1501(+)
MSESSAFWTIVAICEHILPTYTSFRTLLSDIAVLEWMLLTYLPNVHEKLTSLSVSIPAFLSTFYIGIFSNMLPPETCLLIWGQIFHSCSPDIAIMRSVCGVIESTKDHLLQSTTPKEVMTNLMSSASRLYKVDVIFTNSRNTSEVISDEDIAEKRSVMSVNIERDSAKLQTHRSGFRLSTAGIVTKRVLGKLRKGWKKGTDEEVTQHEFLQLMESIGIDSVENNLSKVYKQWAGVGEEEGVGPVTFRMMLLGLVLQMDGGLQDRLRAIIEFMQEGGVIPLERYLEFVSSRVWNCEMQVLAAASNTAFATIDPSLLTPTGSKTLAQTIFSQLHTSPSSLTIPEFTTAILANPSMYLLLNNPQAHPDPAPLWTPSQNPPSWTPDDASPRCYLCQNTFRWYRRRHHCRCCGHLMCNDCTKGRVQIARMGYSYPVRTCMACTEQLKE